MSYAMCRFGGGRPGLARAFARKNIEVIVPASTALHDWPARPSDCSRRPAAPNTSSVRGFGLRRPSPSLCFYGAKARVAELAYPHRPSYNRHSS